MGRMTSCRDCGAEISTKARACPKCGRPKGRSLLGQLFTGGIKAILLLFLGITVLFVLVAVNSSKEVSKRVAATNPDGSSAPATKTPAPPTTFAGDEAILELPGGKGVWLALDDDSWGKMLDAENRQDMEEIALLMAKGKVIRELNGTRVKVIETSLASRKVRVRDGENPGVEAWVQTEFVKPAR